MKTRKNYGWLPQLPDHRDYKFTAPAINLPSLIDLRPQMPPVVDQGQLGSCTANAAAGAYGFEMLKQKELFAPLSRLFIYYYERVLNGTVKTDSGAQLRDAVKVLATNGVCPEKEWPYVVSKFKTKPNTKAVGDAKKELAVQYVSVDNNLTALKSALASGYPLIFGFTVYESFEGSTVAQTGYVPMPGKNEQVLGGHAVCLVGYDDSKQMFIVRNSWGESWGLSGYCYMPYAYLTNKNLASDFWMIQKVS